MEGIQFLLDAKGQKSAVLIDLRKHADIWEDIYDSMLAKRRRKEPRESFASVKRRLVRSGKLRG